MPPELSNNHSSAYTDVDNNHSIWFNVTEVQMEKV